MDELCAWKFLIGAQKVEDPDRPSTEWFHCLAIVLAVTEEQARTRAQEFAELNGIDAGWIKAARVTRLPLRAGAVLGWHQ